MAEYFMSMYHNLFNLYSIGDYLGILLILAITSKIIVNTFWTYILLCTYLLKNDIEEWN